MEKKRVAIYCRIATPQDEVLRMQIKCVRAFVEDHDDWQLTAIYAEMIKSAGIDRRPEIRHLLRDAESGSFDLVVCASPSRLARRPDEFFAIVDRVEKAGATIEYVNCDSRVIHRLAQLGR